MRITYLFFFAVLLWCSSCQKESINEPLTTSNFPAFEGRALVVNVVSTNPSHHCGQCHQGTSSASTVSSAMVAIFDPAVFKSGDALPVDKLETNARWEARFDDLNLEAYEVVVIYGGNETIRSIETPDNRVSYLNIQLD